MAGLLVIRPADLEEVVGFRKLPDELPSVWGEWSTLAQQHRVAARRAELRYAHVLINFQAIAGAIRERSGAVEECVGHCPAMVAEVQQWHATTLRV